MCVCVCVYVYVCVCVFVYVWLCAFVCVWGRVFEYVLSLHKDQERYFVFDFCVCGGEGMATIYLVRVCVRHAVWLLRVLSQFLREWDFVHNKHRYWFYDTQILMESPECKSFGLLAYVSFVRIIYFFVGSSSLDPRLDCVTNCIRDSGRCSHRSEEWKSFIGSMRSSASSYTTYYFES